MGDEQDIDEALVLRGVAYRMSQGIEIKTHTRGLRPFHNVFLGTVSPVPLSTSTASVCKVVGERNG